MYPSASEILTAFTKNPDEGGKLLFERYYKPLVLFADSFLTDIHFSEDIVQDVFYDFIKHANNIRIFQFHHVCRNIHFLNITNNFICKSF